MAEYIKRNDVIDICEGFSDHCLDACDFGGIDIAERIEEEVIKIPTADVVEVKHGEWIECFNEFNKYCSVCHKMFGTIYDIKPYCPHCGAKMDGGKTE